MKNIKNIIKMMFLTHHYNTFLMFFNAKYFTICTFLSNDVINPNSLGFVDLFLELNIEIKEIELYE